MIISIRHKLTIDFGQQVPRLLLHLLLTPQSGPTQTVLDWQIEIDGDAKTVPMTDGFGNRAVLASLAGVEQKVTLSVAGRVETRGGSGVLGWPMGEPVPWLYHRVTPSTRVPVSIWGKFRGETAHRDGQLNAMHGLMARIHDMLDARAESGDGEAARDPSQTQSQSGGAGTQSQTQGESDIEIDPALEYARTFVGSARALGIPARFVSGYFLASEDDGVESGTHAWAEAHVEGLGWIGFDPRLDVCPTDRHVRVAVGLDAETAVAIRAYPPVGRHAAPIETTEILVAAEADA
ncbi:MAG: transglutaminase family protein [Alphaproteobacteria bacterium]|nr:transglutaminase family protein [Alphaproteobacteria bacterium]